MSKIVTVNDIAMLSIGLNLSREENHYPSNSLYSTKDLESDLESSSKKTVLNPTTSEEYITKPNDIVMSLATKICTVVSQENQNKILKNAFVKITLDEGKVDPWYFCYAINVSNLFKQSISSEVLSIVRPLTISILGNASIKLPTIENQKAIGSIYKNICRINYLNKRKQLLLSQALNNISDKI